MKREQHRYDADGIAVYKTWSLFDWDLCWCCKKEFRRESGWFIYPRKSYRVNKYNSLTVCKSCCNSKDEAYDFYCEYFETLTRTKPRPNPAPPMRRYEYSTSYQEPLTPPIPSDGTPLNKPSPPKMVTLQDGKIE